MANWSTQSSWVSENGRRFNIFKEQNPGAEFLKDGQRVHIRDCKTFQEVKDKLGVKSGANPHLAKIQILLNGTAYNLGQIERPGLRAAGTNAAKMEAFVAVATLANYDNIEQFLEVMQDESKKLELLKRLDGVTVKELDDILMLVEFNKDYATNFIQVARNIIRETPMSADTSKYVVYPRAKWEAFKSTCARLAGRQLGAKMKGDKWNPADILFIKRGLSLEALLDDDLTLINERFNQGVKAGMVIPVSVKQTESAIRGSRGITGELPKDANIGLKQLISGGKIAGVPLAINYDKDSKSVVTDTSLQRRILIWINESGKEHIERTAEIALGLIPLSSIWYEVDNVNVKAKFEDTKEKLNLNRVIVSLLSDAVWLDFGDYFLIVRSKGNSIQVTADAKRSFANVKDIGKFEIDEQHSYLLESYLLDEYQGTIL